MAHNFELSHYRSIIQPCNTKVVQELLRNGAWEGQWRERAIKELLVGLCRLTTDVIEELDCIALSVNKHAKVQDIDYTGPFCHLNPS